MLTSSATAMDRAAAPQASLDEVRDFYLTNEFVCLTPLLDEAAVDTATLTRIQHRARELVKRVRAKGRRAGGIDAFLLEYDLSSQEGVMLMCIAEALLRIPDDNTADRLIQEKLSEGEWNKHFGHSPSLFVNASTWGLMLTGRMIGLDEEELNNPRGWLSRLISRTGEPVARMAMRQAMRILGQQFVMGQTINEALKRSRSGDHQAYRHSFDMLGEAALTQQDADRYFEAYCQAIEALTAAPSTAAALWQAPSLSVKLSALHPRYEFSQRERVLAELTPRLLTLAQKARAANTTLTVDAEESDRLALSLDLFSAVYHDPSLQGWQGFGLAVQAYQKRAPAVLAWLFDLARQAQRRIPVRLVKGAYWDTEIKRAQERGLSGYPVYTRKASTDVAYLACAKRMLAATDAVYPQFASHNAHTIAYILELAGDNIFFEFQRLHGMGDSLYEEVLKLHPQLACRTYAPVGGHKELLPYLVRRLLENGANTSFVNRLSDEKIAVDDVIANPVEKIRRTEAKAHPRIPLPIDLFGNSRKNAQGLNLDDSATVAQLYQEIEQAWQQTWSAAPLMTGARGEQMDIRDPADHNRVVGHATLADEETVDEALRLASAAAVDWDQIGAEKRAACLLRAADLFEQQRSELMALCIREAGKSLTDALAEVREAVDFCRYYAALSQQHFATTTLAGPTGEHNELTLHGRGVFACISPWNFPLAIFVGQVAAALVAGNSVVAKPAGQTPLIAARAVKLFYQAGITADVLQLLPGHGSVIGSKLACDPRVSGIAFTGSTATARAINEKLAARSGPIIPFIAETGGQNAMIVDSSALVEQVVIDIVQSAFNSAGQRCSALRVLFVQQEIAPRLMNLLAGSMTELRVGDPALLATDVGPVIDGVARDKLIKHIEQMRQVGKLIGQTPLDPSLDRGYYVAPHAFLIENLNVLKGEVFGPILHVIPYEADHLQQVIDSINNTGYGLTLGIHSRLNSTIKTITDNARVGNVYVNRNMIGAVVGVQPFGGQGLSGTGPKAGGPHYLQRFTTERAYSINTAALGGNPALLGLEE